MQTTMNGYDVRQLRLMKSVINKFIGGKISLVKLIINLEGLVDVLERNLDWENRFFDHRARLEIVYTMALCEERSELNQTDHEIIIKSLKHIMDLVETRLGPEGVLEKH